MFRSPVWSEKFSFFVLVTTISNSFQTDAVQGPGPGCRWTQQGNKEKGNSLHTQFSKPGKPKILAGRLNFETTLSCGVATSTRHNRHRSDSQNQGNTCTEIGTLLAENGYRVYDSNFREVPVPSMCEDLPIGDMFAKLMID